MIVHCNQNIKDIYYNNHHIQHIYGCDGHLVYSGGTTPPTPPTPSYSGTYFTSRALENRTKFKFSYDVQYSLDSGGTWSTLSASTFTEEFSSGTTIMWKANIRPTFQGGVGNFDSNSKRFEVLGNPLSLILGDNFEGVTDISAYPYTFRFMFSNASGLVSAENLSLPATTLAERCYEKMFQNCSNLTTAPKSLPATTLTNDCYASMFFDCTQLTTVPELMATTLAERCYEWMFRNCTSLTTAPQLLATTLDFACYEGMFANCTSLTTAPTLSATTLYRYCYNQMFINCTSLTNVTCLATDISASNCTSEWLKNVAPTGTFTTPSSTNWTSGTDGIPTAWTRQNI